MGHTESHPIYYKSAAELATMRRAGRLLQRIIREVCDAAAEGITTAELDKMAYSRIREAGARPAFLNLYGFPKTCCISVNEQVVHGVPGKYKLKNGDVLKVDCGLVLDGFFADTAYSVPIGTVSPQAEELLRVTRECLFLGIEQARPGNRTSDISRAIYEHLRRHGYSPAEGLTGHGVGRHLHEEPQVPNKVEGRGIVLKPGLVVAIEPMVNIGTGNTKELKDGWTVVTADGSLSAHYEHTVAITENGPEILTAATDEEAFLPAAAKLAGVAV